MHELPEDVWHIVARHLHVHERIGLSYTCKDLRFLASSFGLAAPEQAVRKHYVNVQVQYLRREWTELRRMRAAGMTVVHAPNRLSTFMLGGVAAKRMTVQGAWADCRLWHDMGDEDWDPGETLPLLFLFASGPANAWPTLAVEEAM